MSWWVEPPKASRSVSLCSGLKFAAPRMHPWGFPWPQEPPNIKTFLALVVLPREALPLACAAPHDSLLGIAELTT